MLAKRYRIVSLLGRGGMGEVYRADDLKLGQPVALKFLPAGVERNRARLDRFLNEVRIARKVSHPNVCRVYDVGEVEGSHFLSMEFVDGEDLASLMRRIGRLPQEKAIQIARQLCAGLAAAHEEGVLHRDLKPANVMIDGRGRARITDFGLAVLAESIAPADVVAGTPAYMAPEQSLRKEVTVQSDLYALGLVLYEMFTGKRAFEARSLQELRRLQIESTPSKPSSHVEGIDANIERVILQCLEKEPAERPKSALAVASALPGGDPLAAALLAGETPSPEMVAAAGSRTGLRPAVAGVWLAVAILGLLAEAALREKISLWPPLRAFEVLENDARGIAERLGYTIPPVDTAAWLSLPDAEYRYLLREHATGEGWEALRRPGPLLAFNYREGGEPMVPEEIRGLISFEDPPMKPGDVSMTLDSQGRLIRFQANPPHIDFLSEPAPAPDWSIPFEAAGLDIRTFEPTAPSLVPPAFADARQGWIGSLKEQDDRPVRIEAASFRARPVYFEVIFPSNPAWDEISRKQDSAEPTAADAPSASSAVGAVLIGMILSGAIWLAMRNLSLGRGDRKSAMRLAVIMFILSMLVWGLRGHHVVRAGEMDLLGRSMSLAVFQALVTWVFYVAIEPHFRRTWPEALTSWNRVLAGRVRDPLVGRDLLAGCALAGALSVFGSLRQWAGITLGTLPPGVPNWPLALQGGRYTLAHMALWFRVILVMVLLQATLLILLRVIMRRKWAANLSFVAVQTLWAALGASAAYGGVEVSGTVLLVRALGGLTFGGSLVILLVRFGVLSWVPLFLLDLLPLITDTSAPYFASSLIGPITFVALAFYAYRISLAGRPVFSESTRT